VLEGESVLCFSSDPWGSIWPDKPQIMSILARRNRVLYVEPELHFRPAVRKIVGGEVKLSSLRRGRASWLKDELHVYHPPAFAPISGHAVLGPLTRALRFGLLRQTLRQLGMSKPILWLFHPSMVELVGQFGEKLVVYHVVDEYSAYAGHTPESARWVREQEAYLASRADIVFAASQALWQAKRHLNPHTYLSQNAVDCDLFARVIANNTAVPADIGALRRPVIGLVGSIASWQDYDLLQFVAESHPAWSLAMIGPIHDMQDTEELKRLQRAPNVHFLGRKPPDEIPRYMNACDVCLIPYKVNGQTTNAGPLKLYEYFACGKPVVSVDVPAVRPFAELIYIADNKEMFAQCIEKALQAENGLAARRLEVARQNTWEARVERISRLVEARLDDKTRLAQGER